MTPQPKCDIREVYNALGYLRAARECLKATDHPRATDKVRRAITSTEGALRHHMNREASERRQASATVGYAVDPD